MRKITKLFSSKATSIDEATRTVRFKISDDQPDRMGEIVKQDWDLTNYKNNPIVLFGHDPSQPENVLGTADVEVGISESYADVKFDDEINPKAKLVWQQVLKGTLRCVSVGFINHTYEMEEDTPVLRDNELLEISIVPIPANPRAIALGLKDGSISKKDANFLLDTMKREAEYIEAQLEASNEEVETKDMKDIEEKIATLTDLVGKLGDNVTTLAEKVDQLVTKGEQPAEDKDEHKDDVVEEHQEEGDGSAKGGDDDQSGAEEADIDLDAELTPELEEQIEAELAEVA